MNVRVARSFRNSYSPPLKTRGIAAFLSGNMFFFFALCIRKDSAMTPALRYLPALRLFCSHSSSLAFCPRLRWPRALHPKTLSRQRIVCQALPPVSGTLKGRLIEYSGFHN